MNIEHDIISLDTLYSNFITREYGKHFGIYVIIYNTVGCLIILLLIFFVLFIDNRNGDATTTKGFI